MPIEPPVESPQTLGDAYALMASARHAPIAGGTDLMVQITGELVAPPERVLDLWRLDELRGIDVVGDVLRLGALTTYTEIRRSEACRRHVPILVEAAATIGAAQIQNRGTLGGNIANASPAGDTLPVLLALDARIVAGSTRGERTIDAGMFWVGYRKTALDPDELVLRVEVPLVDGRHERFRKVGTRRAQAISKVVMALAWRQVGRAVESADMPAWSEVRLALGSVAERPIRALQTEALLEGAQPTEATADVAAETLSAEIHPIDDVRSTAGYRRTVAARVLHRLIREAGGW
ncbi:MAG TPA: xanthine dehydrogenase family protein subunit M [Candidatus Limnocylindrales bacterium]|jgi:CO/xanthine dehydrogenase FAD-binding subunit